MMVDMIQFIWIIIIYYLILTWDMFALSLLLLDININEPDLYLHMLAILLWWRWCWSRPYTYTNTHCYTTLLWFLIAWFSYKLIIFGCTTRVCTLYLYINHNNSKNPETRYSSDISINDTITRHLHCVCRESTNKKKSFDKLY